MIKYLREGRGICSSCHKERDVVIPVVPKPDSSIDQHLDPVVSRHLPWTELITNRGTYPKGFCLGSLKPEAPRQRPKK